jgi:hypothetical protein
MTEEILTIEATKIAAAGGSEEAIAVPGKCIKLSVRTAVLKPKFHSNRQKDGRFIAGIASLTTGSSKLKPLKVKLK